MTELRLDDLVLEKAGDHLSIHAVLPESLGQAAIGRKLREVVSHPMLDPLDIDILDYKANELIIQNEMVTAAPPKKADYQPAELLQRYREWEKTWNVEHTPLWL